MTSSPNRVLEAQSAVLNVAVPSGVQVSFGEGRRRTDLTLALLKGERLSVLTVAPRLLESLPFDLEIVRSAQLGGSYELMVALTERLDEQPVRAPERRHKLLRRVSDAPFDPETSVLLDAEDA